jgi:hypothetical protein
VPNGKRDWDQARREACLMRNRPQQLLVRIDGRATELEDRRLALGSLHDPGDRFRNVFHIGRLQSGPAAAEHRIDWKPTKQLEDGAEKRVVWSEHRSRTDETCIGEFRADRLFAFAAHSDVAGWRGGIGTDPRNLNKPIDSRPAGLGRQSPSRLDVDGVESLRSALAIKADRIDDSGDADQRFRDGSLVVNVGLEGLKSWIVRTWLAQPCVRMP